MPSRADRPTAAADPNRGRFDPARVGQPNPQDQEPRPAVAPEDAEAAHAELEDLKRQTRRRSA